MTERPKYDGRVTDVGFVGEHDLEDSDVFHCRGRDAGDQQEDG